MHSLNYEPFSVSANSLPFSEADILSINRPTYQNKCDTINPTNFEKEQCRNETLAKWYTEYLELANATPQKLSDIADQYDREWIKSANLSIGILCLAFFIFQSY